MHTSTSISKQLKIRKEKIDSRNEIDNDFEIIEASYGSKNNEIDVTEKLKKAVVNNRLAIVASNQISGDPDRGYLKKLKIKYKYNGKEFVTTYPERQFVDLP